MSEEQEEVENQPGEEEQEEPKIILKEEQISEGLS